MSVAIPFDVARKEILDRYQPRIDRGDRTRLTREERDNLALLLVNRLVELNWLGTGMPKRQSASCVRLRRRCWSAAAQRGRSIQYTCQRIPAC